jgi:outer membrane murein-binding lipoprotein Lpp
MDEESFRRKLGEILGVIDPPAMPSGEPANAWNDQLTDSVARLTAAVDQLRIRVKYLVFDLEATRRENRYLRGIIERSAGGPLGGGES